MKKQKVKKNIYDDINAHEFDHHQISEDFLQDEDLDDKYRLEEEY